MIIDVDSRAGHLRRLKKTAKSQRFIFWDCETKPAPADSGKIDEFILAVAEYCTIKPDGTRSRKTVSTYYDADSLYKGFRNELTRNSSINLIAHNTSYDMIVSDMLSKFLNDGFEIKAYYSTAGTTVIMLLKDGKRVRFLDSMNWFPVKLAKIGETIGVPKMSIEFEKASQRELAIYCKRDVLILVKMFSQYKKFLADNFNLNIGLTRGTDAMNIFRKSNRAHMLTYHNDLESLKFQYSCYYGGRTECFKIGKLAKKDWYKVDVNSLYPHVMYENEYPYKFDSAHVNPPISMALESMRDFTLAGHVTVDIKEACFPLRMKRKLLFPVGEFSTFLCANELKYALNNGLVKKIHYLEKYQQIDLFKSVINQLSKLKIKAETDGDKVNRGNIKLIMNSIYGKFAQKLDSIDKLGSKSSKQYDTVHVLDDNLEEIAVIRAINYDEYRFTKEVLGRNTFPIVSACVASNARALMWDFIKIAGLKHIAYMDTDSLIVNRTGFSRLNPYIDDTKLGYFKLESQSRDVEIWGNKFYRFGTETHRKGLPASAVHLGNNKWQYEQWVSLNRIAFSGSDGKGQRQTVVKDMNTQYTKGRIQKDRTIRPFTILGQKYTSFSESDTVNLGV